MLFLFACNVKQENGPLEIYHLEPNDIIYRENDGQGWYAKERHDFFAVKNFDISNEEHKIKIDNFIIDYIKYDDFLAENDNASWGLVFYRYGNGITEDTKHEYGTDYQIHNLFAFEKRLVVYAFDTKDTYNGTIYHFNKGDSLVCENRKLFKNYFKEKATN
ncbi:MAG: hypothetical protein AAF620_10505 [Bacteroidota bacterium]